MEQDWTNFEGRKKDHIRIALSPEGQSISGNGLDQIMLIPEALPDLDLSEIQILEKSFGVELKPFVVSSMTAGHTDSLPLNRIFAAACAKQKWLFAVGSQRRELKDKSARSEWVALKSEFPELRLAGNLGISQLIHTSQAELDDILSSMQASALYIHTNPLQEAIQKEGTPQFRGSFDRLEKLVAECRWPVILKEVGSGFSIQTLKKLASLPLFAVDLAGLGGTHWGRVEGRRAEPNSVTWQRGEMFADWGLTNVEILSDPDFPAVSWQVWASGGVRHGLDAAKLIAMGANRIGFAKQALEQAKQGLEPLHAWMEQVEEDLKVALFATGRKTPGELRKGGLWRIRK